MKIAAHIAVDLTASTIVIVEVDENPESDRFRDAVIEAIGNEADEASFVDIHFDDKHGMRIINASIVDDAATPSMLIEDVPLDAFERRAGVAAGLYLKGVINFKSFVGACVENGVITEDEAATAHRIHSLMF